MPKRRQPETERVRHLVALDAANVVRRLEKRHGDMVEIFARHRDRSALVEPLRSWFPSATFADMRLLDAREQRAISRFYEALDELRWYLRHTEDMPGTLRLVFDSHRTALANAYAELSALIGSAEAEPEPEDADDVIAAAVRASEERARGRGKKPVRKASRKR